MADYADWNDYARRNGPGDGGPVGTALSADEISRWSSRGMPGLLGQFGGQFAGASMTPAEKQRMGNQFGGGVSPLGNLNQRTGAALTPAEMQRLGGPSPYESSTYGTFGGAMSPAEMQRFRGSSTYGPSTYGTSGGAMTPAELMRFYSGR